jgi:hypothetical protein
MAEQHTLEYRGCTIVMRDDYKSALILIGSGSVWTRVQAGPKQDIVQVAQAKIDSVVDGLEEGPRSLLDLWLAEKED